jgi:hypoxanthine phosphoribosyltransferase
MARAGNDPIDLAQGAAVAPRRNARRRLHPILPPLPVPSVADIEPAASRRRAAAEQPPFAPVTFDNGDETKPKRRRGARGGRRHKKAPAAEATVEIAPPPEEAQPEESEAKPKRRRGARGGRKHKKAAPEATVEVAPPPEETEPEEGEGKPKRRRGTRGGRKHKKATAEAPKEVEPEAKPRARRRTTTTTRKAAAETVPSTVAARLPLTSSRTRTPVTGAPTGKVPAPFAHPAEYEFARILDFYGIEWRYEPRSFPLRYDYGHVVEAFTPDFYLPDLNMYVEVTTLKTGLTAEKNRKMRLLKELYPEVNIKLLKKRDYLRLLAKYGYGPLAPEQVPDIDRVLFPATKIQRRVGELGARISHDYAGKEPVLIGVLRGVLCFMSDLMRNISVPTAVDFMSISSYEGGGSGGVRILKDLDENIKGRDVILVEDIVDTGMTLNHIMEYLQSKRPASLKVCALLDKPARRIANVPLDYVGFEIPDEFVVGYGLDFRQRFRNLPFIAILKHDLLP